MKLQHVQQGAVSLAVVPYAGTWIETMKVTFYRFNKCVVPYAGTWIETSVTGMLTAPSPVVPYAGTWIETALGHSLSYNYPRRSLRGNVD